MTRKTSWCWRVAWSALGLTCFACSQSPLPSERDELRVGEEVFRIFCKRVARAEFPEEATGLRFNAACDQGAEQLTPAIDRPRFRALVERRTQLVAALDQTFGDTPVEGGTRFRRAGAQRGELDEFLAQLIPFYDDGTLPASTRAIAQLAQRLARAEDAQASAVLDKLAALSARQGYRPKARVIAATRALLDYERLDEVSERLLALLGEGGAGHDVFTRILQATALELADAPSPASGDSTLHIANTLLLAPLRDPAAVAASRASASAGTFLASADEVPPKDPVYFVRRDPRGEARLAASFQLSEGMRASDLPRPFAPGGRSENLASFARDASGRLSAGTGGPPVWAYGDANATLLGALLRAQVPLLARKASDQRSTVEKLLYGLKPLLGPQGARSFSFNSGRSYAFQGPALDESPLLDLIHALASLTKYEETDRLLEVLRLLIARYESEASGPVFAALAIDRDADKDARAQLLGSDGAPSEFWDDLIAVGQRVAQRPGMLEAVLRAFAQPSAAANTALIAKFMKYKDRVTYNGAPLAPETPGQPEAFTRPTPSHPNLVYSEQQARALNSPATRQLATPVDRSQPDTGMNRSLFQRLISAIDATNGAENCNKEGAVLHSTTDFPYHTDGSTAGYARCAFVRQPNGAETHMRSMLGRARVTLKDANLLQVAELLKRDVGLEQEHSAQISGFTLTPTPEALARFALAPRNTFLTELFDPFPTKHGPHLLAFEPDILFALEARQEDVRLDGAPQSFLSASKQLVTAFDDHELFASGPDGEIATQGYLFAELLGTLHKHWPSPRTGDCPTALSAGDEGCSQRLDPARPFYAAQSNLVSYEPLLVRALEEHRLGAVLQQASARLAQIEISTADGRTLDGITVLADFVKAALLPDARLAYRDGSKSTKTNACVLQGGSCAGGRGRVLAQTTPLYMMLDALQRIDAIWAQPEHQERHAIWLEARSELIDQLLSVDATGPDDERHFTLRDRRGRALALELLGWLRGKVLGELHPFKRADGTPGDRAQWADGLAERMRKVLAHPLLAHGVELFDVLWEDARASEELARLNAHLMDFDDNPAGFADLLLAAADSLEFADLEPNLTPVVQFAALALAPDALEAIRGGGSGPDVLAGAAYRGLEVARKVALLDLYRGKLELSPLTKLLQNALLPGGAIDGRAPAEVIFDAIAEVNRADPSTPEQTPLARGDAQQVFEQLRQFMLDEERGLERLYRVVRGRSLEEAQVQP